MLKVSDVAAAVAAIAPPGLAAPWDNSGLLVGEPDAPCGRVMVALDITLPVLEEAAARDCQMVISHHPFIFQAQKNVVAGRYESDLIYWLVRHGMAAMAAHTNWDNAGGGINYALCDALGLQNVQSLLSPEQGAEILLLAGDLAESLGGEELAALVRERLGLPVVRAAGLCRDRQYRRIAVCGGAGMDFWQQAAAAGCDALVSADGKHHEGLQAEHAGFAVLDATHFATEIIGIRRLGERLAADLPELEVCYAGVGDSWQFYGADGRM